MSNKIFKKVIVLELNEISKKAIDILINRQQCSNFKYINEHWLYNTTSSEKEYTHIEPWIQWVTVHTGKSFSEHKIFRLSDAQSELQFPQTWEVLSQHNIQSAIVGSMNVTRGTAKGGFFFPDPWSKNTQVYPSQYQALFDLISRKVQTHATTAITKRDLLKAFKICRQFQIPVSLYIKIASQIIWQKLNPKKCWRLAGLFDLLLSEIFKYLLKKTNYGFYTLFLNAVAHYQHHYWRSFDGEGFNKSIKAPDCLDGDDPMSFGYKIYDQILGTTLKIIKNEPDTLVIVLSAMSQVPFTEKEYEGGMNYYRLNDHHQFAQKLGLHVAKVLPMMSRDWQLQYDTPEAMQVDKKILESITLEKGTAVFKVMQNTERSLFIETALTCGVADNEKIYVGNEPLGIFNLYFTNIAIKSGHHTGFGSIWFSQPLAGLTANGEIPLTMVHQLILKALGAENSDKEQVVA